MQKNIDTTGSECAPFPVREDPCIRAILVDASEYLDCAIKKAESLYLAITGKKLQSGPTKKPDSLEESCMNAKIKAKSLDELLDEIIDKLDG